MIVLLKTKEVAEMLRVPDATLRYWRSRGLGPPSFRLRRAVVYDRADVDRWVADQRAETLSGSPPAA